MRWRPGGRWKAVGPRCLFKPGALNLSKPSPGPSGLAPRAWDHEASSTTAATIHASAEPDTLTLAVRANGHPVVAMNIEKVHASQALSLGAAPLPATIARAHLS